MEWLDNIQYPIFGRIVGHDRICRRKPPESVVNQKLYELPYTGRQANMPPGGDVALVVWSN